MARVSLALMWHQHQPYYPDDVAGENPMPWVRLHATKDYLGMALHLEEVPEFQCTINLVPSLLSQLEGYVDGATDTHLIASRKPVDGLEREDVVYLLDNFFMAFADSMIRPHPRYHELYMLRAAWSSSAEAAITRFRPRDLRDLQVWSNLAWIHPLLFEKDSELSEFKAKGRHYSEDDKQWFLDKQRDLLAQVIPLHRKLAERGQIELTTTPYYHPILPLLLDKKLAREAMPDVALPAYREGYPEDAEVHVRRAVESHTRRFGSPPAGMWPSEGSVCQSLIPLLARHGIKWIATDEEILGCSTGGMVGRDSRGYVRHPELLYRAWNVREGEHELGAVFRDHSMSDQVGFHYQRSPGPVAAADFLGKLHAIGDACRHNPATIVPVVLDGENCWEYFPDGGVSFLRSLYQGAARDSRVLPVKVSDFLKEHPPADTLQRLFAGSWISHNFAIWIGHPEDNRGWDALHDTRRFLVAEQQSERHDPALLARAWEEIYIAEGSDWFWWYGDDHSSAQDALFDHLFRKHLRNVYALLSCDPPGSLFTPISQSGSHRPVNDQPSSFLNVKVDGRATYFEWIDGAKYVCGNDRGTMTLVTRGLLNCVWFGFDADRFLVRIDTEGGPAAERLAEADRLRIGFVDPAEREIIVLQPALARPVAYLNHAGRQIANGTTVSVATETILELAVPFDQLDRQPDDAIRFYVELLKGEASVDRAPREGVFELTVPCPDFERIMWQV
ncbi:MAG: glycoside hydrolase family 57 protein [Paludisphaera borealis]|uniref:glycoside hydrolase family 57 protein n=1 Tax=Paludisphaera borealis TaxID=1387353 RepID=UPI002840A412|nr:glycoside hydrolase family 57 protein [Paludisphaera borealis]MDR3622044.1 glycoside hydrolase family 57 protein [Paludisphaera borealis]